MAHVHTGRLQVRHHELDIFGRVYPAVYLRWLAQVAIDASTAVGFDAAWYRNLGAHWLVRRSTLELIRPVLADESLTLRTWVEDFRRVRSHRRYEVADAAGTVVVAAVSDWVLADTATGKPRRIPSEVEEKLGFTPGAKGNARPGWEVPPPPPTPARTPYRVRYAELDSLGHVNNAAYVDILVQGVLDAFEGLGWRLERLAADGGVPWLAAIDIEHLDAALYGDRLEVVTWFAPGDRRIDVHQEAVRVRDGRTIVRGSLGWCWHARRTGALAAPPAGLVDALASVRAA